jgi:hypothetical protein
MANRIGLFGQPTPEEYLNNIGRIDPTDVGIANAGINAPVAVAMGARHLGKGLAQGLFSMYSKSKQKNTLNSIFTNAGDPSKDMDGYLSRMAYGLQKAGMYNEALAVVDKLKEHRIEQAAMEVDSSKAASTAIKAASEWAETSAKLNTSIADKTELKKLQTHRRELSAKLRNDPDNSTLYKEIIETNKNIDKLVTTVGRTPEDRHAGRLDVLQAGIDNVDLAISDIDNMMTSIEMDPTIAGTVGQAKRAIQTFMGIKSDISSVFKAKDITSINKMIDGAAALADNDYLVEGRTDADVDQWVNASFHNPKISEIKVFENSMAYMLARARKPGGRLNMDDIKRAAGDTKVTGIVLSARDVHSKLDFVKKEMLKAKAKMVARKEGFSLKEYRDTLDKLDVEDNVRTLSKEEIRQKLQADGGSFEQDGYEYAIVNGRLKRRKVN